MDEYDVAARRRYVEQVRGLFAGSKQTAYTKTGYKAENSRVDSDSTQPVGISAFVKLRVLLSIFLFAAFVLCDKTENPLFQWKSDEWYQQIETNYDYTNLQKYVMMVTDFDKNN